LFTKKVVSTESNNFSWILTSINYEASVLRIVFLTCTRNTQNYRLYLRFYSRLKTALSEFTLVYFYKRHKSLNFKLATFWDVTVPNFEEKYYFSEEPVASIFKVHGLYLSKKHMASHPSHNHFCRTFRYQTTFPLCEYKHEFACCKREGPDRRNNLDQRQIG
jgi:hypothetical protein